MRQLIAEVVALQAQAATLGSVNIPGLFRDLKASHQALVRFAKSGKTPRDLTSFVASVDVFADNVAAVSMIVQSLKNV
jgi:hypothetical protein